MVINNAGVLDNALVADSDPAKWWKVWEVNLRATFTVTHHLLPSMLAASAGTVICVSSTSRPELVMPCSSPVRELFLMWEGARGLLIGSPGL